MAHYSVGTERTEVAVHAFPSLPLALGTFAFSTTIIGSIFAGFIVPFSGSSLSLLAAVAFFGGLVQLLVGLGQIRREDMILGTVFSSYGGFLMTLAVIVAPSLGIMTTLGANLSLALGLFFLAWTIFTAIFLLSALRMNIALIITFALLFLSYLLLAIGELSGGSGVILAMGGWLSIATGLVAWYTALVNLLRAGHSAFHLPC